MGCKEMDDMTNLKLEKGSNRRAKTHMLEMLELADKDFNYEQCV